MTRLIGKIVLDRLDIIHCVCCDERCCCYTYYPGCNPYSPCRPPLPVVPGPPPLNLAECHFRESILAPDGTYRLRRATNAVQQLLLFGEMQ